jgi:hypothetical protein
MTELCRQGHCVCAARREGTGYSLEGGRPAELDGTQSDTRAVPRRQIFNLAFNGDAIRIQMAVHSTFVCAWLCQAAILPVDFVVKLVFTSTPDIGH